MGNNRKAIFFSADWHVGHKNVIKFDNRPFKDVDHMHRVLINNFNACVPEDGVTYFLGDMGMGKRETLKKVMDELNGTKVLVLGNHDGGVNSMYNNGFDVVLYGANLIISNRKVTLTHCPLQGVKREDIEGMRGAIEGDNWHGEHKNGRYSTPDRGQYHLHGHIHSPNGGRSTKILGRQYDVGVSANNFRPVSISQIESWITKHERGEA